MCHAVCHSLAMSKHDSDDDPSFELSRTPGVRGCHAVLTNGKTCRSPPKGHCECELTTCLRHHTHAECTKNKEKTAKRKHQAVSLKQLSDDLGSTAICIVQAFSDKPQSSKTAVKGRAASVSATPLRAATSTNDGTSRKQKWLFVGFDVLTALGFEQTRMHLSVKRCKRKM